jgi:hypothetical protein
MDFLDDSFAPAKRGGEQVGLTKKGKGTKWMLVVDANGLPLGFHLASAKTSEVTLAEQTLDTVRVSRPRGRPKRRPRNWRAKRGRPVVARKAEYRLRYTVERSFAWLGNYLRLLIRWERAFAIYRGVFACAIIRLCVARLTR